MRRRRSIWRRADRALVSRPVRLPAPCCSLVVRVPFMGCARVFRTADDFAAAGATVAIADTSPDRPGGVDRAFRASEALAIDTAGVVALLRIHAPVPVCRTGTSNGTISAANAGVRLGPSRIAGVVLMSSVWIGGMQVTGLQMLRVPTLIVHNRNDGCPLSPFYQAAPALASKRNAAAKDCGFWLGLAQWCV